MVVLEENASKVDTFNKISKLRPFGQALQHSLENARIDNKNGYALWVEKDYCSPPLAMERESVLDRYFNNITVERVELEQEGWSRIDDKTNVIESMINNFIFELVDSTVKQAEISQVSNQETFQ